MRGDNRTSICFDCKAYHFGCPKKHIAKGGRGFVGAETKTGYYVAKCKDFKKEKEMPAKHSNVRAVAQFTKSWVLVAVHPSMTAAARAIGLRNPSEISKCCRGEAYSASGYIWRYAAEEEDA